MPCQRQQRLHQLRIAAETFRAVHQPQVKLVFKGPQLALQLGVVALGVVHQVAGMHLEKSGEDLTRGVGQVRPGTALNLREVTLAQLLAGLRFNGPDRLLLVQIAVKAAQAAFHFPQVSDFLTELHSDQLT